MKAVLALVLAAAASANALTSCILECQESAASDAGCDVTNYNSTTCYCNNDDYPTDVKACLYENNCDTDVDDFYDYRTSVCGDSTTTDTSSSHVNTSSTVSDQGDALGTCILACQASSAESAECASSNYNETACYCDNDNFALDVKACLYQNCSSEVPVFYNYRADICDQDNSTEYFATLTEADATEGIATTTAAIASGTAATAATTTAASDATATADSTASGSAASASATGSSGAVRDVVYVTGLAVVVAMAMMVVA